MDDFPAAGSCRTNTKCRFRKTDLYVSVFVRALIVWADLKGPVFYVLTFYRCRPIRKTQNYPRTGLRLGLRADIEHYLRYSSIRTLRDSPACRGPRRAGNRPKSRCRICFICITGSQVIPSLNRGVWGAESPRIKRWA